MTELEQDFSENNMETDTIRSTEFELVGGNSYMAYWSNDPIVDQIIHDILYYMWVVEFSGDGNSMTLTITGESVIFYADRVEYNGVVIATAEGYVVDCVTGVIAMYSVI